MPEKREIGPEPAGRPSGRERELAQVLRFWRGLMRDGEADAKDRLKASEYLAKALSAFSEKPGAEKPDEIVVRFDYGDGEEDGPP